MTTPRERIEAVLRLEMADRPPTGWWGHTFLEEWDPARLAAATLDRQRRFGWDYVKFQPRACCFSEVFGSEYRPSGSSSGQPVEVRRAVPSLGDWARLPEAGAGSPAFAEQVEAIRMVVDGVGPGVPVIQTVFSPVMVAAHLAGRDNERVARELVEHPDVVGPALERIARALVDFSAASVAAGAAGIFYAVAGFSSLDVMTAEDYERLAQPYDLAVLRSLPDGAWFNVLHLCGDHLNFGIASMLPAHAVSWDVAGPGNPSLAEGRDRTGRAVLGGVGRTTTLVTGTPAAVEAEVRAAIDDTGGRGLIIGPGCSVPPEAPEENLAALRYPGTT